MLTRIHKAEGIACPLSMQHFGSPIEIIWTFYLLLHWPEVPAVKVSGRMDNTPTGPDKLTFVIMVWECWKVAHLTTEMVNTESGWYGGDIQLFCYTDWFFCGAPPFVGVGNSHVNHRFHPTGVRWNLGLTRKFQTPTFKSHSCLC